MPLDTSIISSYNPGAAPDVNAMLTQQMQGMQNINTLERQRAQDALDMQDRAAAAQKEQEAAAIKALLPAYTYGIQTGDIAGAGNLVPPEMRGQLQPFIDALAGKSPQEVQSALIGSLSSSPEGQEALAAIQRSQTYGVQARQAKTAEDRLALDAERQAAELAAGNKVASREVDAQGNVHFFDAYGNEIRVAQGAGKPSAAAATTTTTPEGMNPKTQAKFDEAFPKSSSALRTAVTGMDNTLTALEKLINDPGLELISGTVGAYTPDISADAKRAKALFDQIKAGAGLAALVELKQASPSGGALGNVSNQEGNTLRDSRGAFLQTQEYEDLRRALIDYYGVLERSKANIIGAFNDTYAYRGENAAENVLQSAQQQAEEINAQIQERFPDVSNQPAPTSIRRVK